MSTSECTSRTSYCTKANYTHKYNNNNPYSKIIFNILRNAAISTLQSVLAVPPLEQQPTVHVNL